AHIRRMTPEEHDRVLAAVSHLPHLAAYALVRAVLRMRESDLDPLDFAAGGFRDFTRIASSSPEMWRDIVLTNREALLAQIDALADELASLREALESRDGARLLSSFTEAKQARDAWLKRLESMPGGQGR
ncbi:MAG: prephenate dehydrogenase/arogenate dehydrogenase family protein, partial [Deltaproteobacteria bacterium]